MKKVKKINLTALFASLMLFALPHTIWANGKSDSGSSSSGGSSSPNNGAVYGGQPSGDDESYNPEQEDGWDGTAKTYGEEANNWHEREVGTKDYDYENYTCVSDKDGNLVSIGVTDVYDTNGNFIYSYDGPGSSDPNEKAAVEARIQDFFKDKVIQYGEDALKEYTEATKEIESVLSSGDSGGNEQKLESLYKKQAEAKAMLDAVCNATGYKWQFSDEKLSGSIVDKNGKTKVFVGDPVIFSTGEFFIDDVDVTVSGKKSVFSVSRHYSSGELADEKLLPGFFGRGWTSNLESRIVACKANLLNVPRYPLYGLAEKYIQAVPDVFIYFHDNGGLVFFEKNPDGQIIPLKAFSGSRISFSETDDGYCVSYDAYGEKRYYSKEGLPQLYTLKNGGKIEFSYDESMKLSSISLDGEKSLSFFWDGRKLTGIKDEKGSRSISYSFSDGNLSAVTDAEGDTRQFAYNPDGIISKQIKADGSFVSFAFEDINGTRRTVMTTDEEGNSEKFFYDVENRTVTYIDRKGEKSSFTYDERGRTVSCTYPDGGFMFYEYDYENRLLSKTDSSGKISFSYDENGNMTEKLYPDGSCEKWTYCEYGISSFSDRDGIMLRYFYDINGRLSDIYRGSHKLSHFEYDCENMLVSDEDCSGNKVRYKYDNDGNLIEKSIFAPGKNIASATEKWSYDSCGRVLVYTDALGKKTSYSYGIHSFSASSENGLYIEENYSERKQLLSYTMTDTKTGEKRRVSYQYDRKNDCTAKYISGVDCNGKPIAEKKIYDSRAYGAGEGLESEVGDIGFEFNYSPAGRVLSSKKKHGGVTEYLYDNEFGYRSGVREVNGTANSFDRTEYLADGRKESYTDRNGRKEHYFYDEFKNLVKIVSPSGTKEFKYDKIGRILSATVKSSSGKLIKTDSWEYEGRKIIHTAGNYIKTIYELNAFGETVSVSDGFEKTSFCEDLCRAAFDAEGSFQKTASTGFYSDFDDDGKNLVVSDSLGNKNSFTFDGFGRKTSWKNALGDTCEIKYNPDASVKSIKNFNGTTESYFYGQDGLSFSLEYSEGGKSFYEYDFAGNLVRAKNDSADLYFEYDLTGNLIRQFDSFTGKEISYEYDSRGNIVKMKSKDRVVSYEWGRKNELLCAKNVLIQDSGLVSCEVKFVYDETGHEILRVYDSGESVKSFYDKNGRRILMLGYASDLALVFVDGSVFDENGRKIYSLDSNFLVTAYSYDDFGRLASVSYPYSENRACMMKDFCGDAALHYLEDSTSLPFTSLSGEEYDSLQKLCSMIPFGSYQVNHGGNVLRESFMYDSNNNLIARSNPYGTVKYVYDAENRLVSWGNGCSAEYDADGCLTAKNTCYTKIAFSYNGQNRISFVSGTDLLENESFERKYDYDALGRRIYEWKSGEGGRNISYIGLSSLIFDSEACFSGELNDSSKSASRSRLQSPSNRTGRYVFIDEKKSGDKSRQKKASSSHSRTQKDSYPLLDSDGNPLSYFSLRNFSDGGKSIVITDSSKNVGCEISSSGNVKAFDYDSFGSPVAENSDYGFVAKNYDSQTGLYDFGFRDYEPSLCRFTSVDPACYGKNWYSYCNGNPISYYDPNGLYEQKLVEQYMQNIGENVVLGKARWDFELNDDNDVIKDLTVYTSDQGCLVTLLSEIMTAFSGVPVTNDYINSQKKLFSEPNAKWGLDGGELNWQVVEKSFGIKQRRVFESTECATELNNLSEMYNIDLENLQEESGESKVKLLQRIHSKPVRLMSQERKIESVLSEIAKSPESVAVVARVCYNATSNLKNKNFGLHFVGVGTTVETINNRKCVAVTATSINDTAAYYGGKRKEAGWILYNGQVYVPLSIIQRIDAVVKNH